VTGAAELRYDSVSSERAGAARLDFGNERFVLHADGFARKTDDLRIPAMRGPRTSRRCAGRPAPLAAAEQQWQLGRRGGAGSAILDNGYVGAAYSNYASRYAALPTTTSGSGST